MARRFNWKTSAAKAIIVSNLESGIHDEDVPLPRVAWDQIYRHMHELTDVTFEQFGRNLIAEQTRFSTNRNRAAQEEPFMKRDRQLHPRKEFNSRGEPVFDIHAAKLEPREDVKAGLHRGKTPSDFQDTRTKASTRLFSKNISTRKKGYKSTIIIVIKSKLRSVNMASVRQIASVRQKMVRLTFMTTVRSRVSSCYYRGRYSTVV
jgi:hypothetical protein